MKINVPPIKSQGIKTKLVPWIKSNLPAQTDGRWIEPFLGTGVVVFNVVPQQALLSDINPHLINFYKAIQQKHITPEVVRHFLNNEGGKLLEKGEEHYYEIRARFNKDKDPLDFLFLNRAGFNGMIRFNQKGGFNVPFCRKPQRFAQAYITKIVNQVSYIYQLLQVKDYEFICQDFSETIKQGKQGDVIYCDPPYIGRHVDYFNGWDEERELRLNENLSKTSSHFVLSTWHSNDFRKNEYIQTAWKNFHLTTREHYYHLGGKEENRNPIIEALITNYQPETFAFEPKEAVQLSIFEQQEKYKNNSDLALN